MKLAMKKIVYIAVVTFFFAQLLSYAQCHDCDDEPSSEYDCPNWTSPPSSHPLSILGGEVDGCYYDISYSTRKCVNKNNPNDTIYCVKIDEIKLVPCAGCSSTEIDGDIIQQAIEIVLFWARGIFDLDVLGSSYPITVSIENCLDIVTESNPTRYVYDNANCDDCCCSMSYNLSTGYDGVTSVTNKSMTKESDCPTAGPYSDCENHCSELDSVGIQELNSPYPPDCSNDCCEGDWSSSYTIGELGSCTFTIFYETKDCKPSGEEAIRFERVITSSDYSCSQYNKEDILVEALKKVLRKQFKEDKDKDRIYQTQSCWSRYDRLLVPCQDDDCCSSTYTVNTYNDEDYIETIAHTDPSATCAGACDDWCEEQDLDAFTLDENSIIFDVDENQNFSDKNSYAKPNPTSGEIEIYYISEITGPIELQIFNSIGETVKAIRKNKNSRTQVFSVDMKNYSEGVYYYRIEAKGKFVANGKFLLNR